MRCWVPWSFVRAKSSSFRYISRCKSVKPFNNSLLVFCIHENCSWFLFRETKMYSKIVVSVSNRTDRVSAAHVQFFRITSWPRAAYLNFSQCALLRRYSKRVKAVNHKQISRDLPETCCKFKMGRGSIGNGQCGWSDKDRIQLTIQQMCYMSEVFASSACRWCKGSRYKSSVSQNLRLHNNTHLPHCLGYGKISSLRRRIYLTRYTAIVWFKSPPH